MWIALKFFVLLQSKQLVGTRAHGSYVVNCSQIFCTFAVETTNEANALGMLLLWIALKFFVLLQSKQRCSEYKGWTRCCELLSNFLYFCSRNNQLQTQPPTQPVVNCSQIFCTFAVETTCCQQLLCIRSCELLSNFLYFCSRNNSVSIMPDAPVVVNCSQIFCTFAVETTSCRVLLRGDGCELLSNFLYFCSRNNILPRQCVVPLLWIALKFFVLLQSKQPAACAAADGVSCELLSNFLYFCSRNNLISLWGICLMVVNCSQIFCTFAVETTL